MPIESLMKFIFPLENKLQINPVNVFIEHEAKTFSSFLLLGPVQIQKTGLMFQAALTNASLEKKVIYIAPQQLTRLPPSVHSLPQPEINNMEFVEFKYIETKESLLQFIASIQTGTETSFPQVLVIDDLQYYARQFHTPLLGLLRLSSLLADLAAFLGRKQNIVIQLYVSCDIKKIPKEQQSVWKNQLQLLFHEVWILEGNSNRLLHGDTFIRFSVLKPYIYLNTVNKV